MTDFEKVKMYYAVFDEWSRMDAPSGHFEYEQTLSEIKKCIKLEDTILDLGGGPGRYSIALAQLGHNVHLADISQDLLGEAQKRISKLSINSNIAISCVNAIDLSRFESESFSVVLLLGPLYHLTTSRERHQCLKEVGRVLKPGGRVIASFIPYLSGAAGILDRAFTVPDQVNTQNLSHVFKTGIFLNAANRGFQEGYYPKPEELCQLFEVNGFNKEKIRSVRGLGFNREEALYRLKEENFSLYEEAVKQINASVEDTSIINLCAHALYIGINQRDQSQ